MTAETTQHYFTLKEAAIAYAIAAERIFANDYNFVNANEALKPLIGNHLFQSLEISIKHACISSGLFTARESRSRDVRSGHGIKELGLMAIEKLGGENINPLVMAMTHNCRQPLAGEVLYMMIIDERYERTRNIYASRRLGYGEIGPDDYTIITPIEDWISLIREIAEQCDAAAGIIKQWIISPSQSQHFAIWYQTQITT